jgi:hypothetical protein
MYTYNKLKLTITLFVPLFIILTAKNENKFKTQWTNKPIIKLAKYRFLISFFFYFNYM